MPGLEWGYSLWNTSCRHDDKWLFLKYPSLFPTLASNTTFHLNLKTHIYTNKNIWQATTTKLKNVDNYEFVLVVWLLVWKCRLSMVVFEVVVVWLHHKSTLMKVTIGRDIFVSWNHIYIYNIYIWSVKFKLTPTGSSGNLACLF